MVSRLYLEYRIGLERADEGIASEPELLEMTRAYFLLRSAGRPPLPQVVHVLGDSLVIPGDIVHIVEEVHHVVLHLELHFPLKPAEVVLLAPLTRLGRVEVHKVLSGVLELTLQDLLRQFLLDPKEVHKIGAKYIFHEERLFSI